MYAASELHSGISIILMITVYLFNLSKVAVHYGHLLSNYWTGLNPKAATQTLQVVSTGIMYSKKYV